MHQVDAVTAADIESRIALEDVKVARYRREYVARWLVLVKGAAGPSTSGFFTADASAARYDSRFDKVFLLELDHHRCHELSSDSGTGTVGVHRTAS
jgi:hypothetical protein